jgi:hypothetical protein
MRHALLLLLGLSLGGTPPPPANPVEAVVQRQVEAYNAHDLDAFVACYDPAIEFRTLEGAVNPEKGVTALRKGYADLFQRHPDLKVKVLNRICQGSFVIDQDQAEGMGPAPITVTAIYQVAGGKILRVWFIQG